MKNVILIKLGGSLITDKNTPYTPKLQIIKKLIVQIKKIKEKYPDTLLILGNGAGSYGHYAATKLKVSSGLSDEAKKFGFAFVQSKVKELNSILVDELLKQKVNAISIQPSSIMTASNGKIKNVATEALSGILSLGIVPVIYGDIVYDEKKGSHIFSTEDQFEILIEKFHKKKFKVSKVVYLSVVNGVLDNTKKVVPHIDKNSYQQIQKYLYKTEGFDVTGGMRHKIERSLSIAKKGIKTVIVNGEQNNILTDVMAGKKIGTSIS